MLTTSLGRRAGASPLLLAGVLAAVLVVSMGVAVSQGAATVPLGDVRRLLWAALTGGTLAREDQSTYSILWDLRVPRVLLAALVGAGLAIAGVACQALVRNPLADPAPTACSARCSRRSSSPPSRWWCSTPRRTWPSPGRWSPSSPPRTPSSRRR